MKYIKRAALCAMSLLSSTVFANDSTLNEETYSLGSTKYISESLNPLSSNFIEIDGQKILVGITGWGDSGGNSDSILEQGDIKGWENGQGIWGYGIYNKDAQYNNYKKNRYFDTHSLDNYTNEGLQDFDMFLVSFSEEVTLTSAAFSYKNGGDGEREITVAGLKDVDAFKDGANSTWSSVYNTVVENTLGHFSLGDKVNGVYESSFTNTISGAAQYWLVGAYNTVFDKNNTSHTGIGLKLASLNIGLKDNTHQPPSTEVSEPGALALMGLGLGLVLYRRKRRV